jgi:hypothetical protein
VAVIVRQEIRIAIRLRLVDGAGHCRLLPGRAMHNARV